MSRATLNHAPQPPGFSGISRPDKRGGWTAYLERDSDGLCFVIGEHLSEKEADNLAYAAVLSADPLREAARLTAQHKRERRETVPRPALRLSDWSWPDGAGWRAVARRRPGCTSAVPNLDDLRPGIVALLEGMRTRRRRGGMCAGAGDGQNRSR